MEYLRISYLLSVKIALPSNSLMLAERLTWFICLRLQGFRTRTSERQPSSGLLPSGYLTYGKYWNMPHLVR